MLLIAPGCTRQTPVVATVSGVPARTGRAFDREHGFGCRAQRVSTPGHQHGAGVASLALPRHAKRRGCGDRRDDADRGAGALKQRALLDVQLDEGGEMVRSEPDFRKLTLESRGTTELDKTVPLGILEAAESAFGKTSGKRAASETANPESRRFFTREQQDLDRPDRREPRTLQRAHGLDRPEYADRAVEPA